MNDETTLMPMLTGYCSPLSAKPGDKLEFMLSAKGTDNTDIQIVKLIHGDENPKGPGFIEHEIDASCNKNVGVGAQFTQVGNYVEVPSLSKSKITNNSFTVHAYIFPTTISKGRQAIISQWDETEEKGFSLEINENECISLRLGDGQQSVVSNATVPLLNKVWYRIAASYDAISKTISLYQVAVINSCNSLLSPIIVDRNLHQHSESIAITASSANKSVLFSGYHTTEAEQASVAGLFNGKIDRSGIQTTCLNFHTAEQLVNYPFFDEKSIIVYWDTTEGYTDNGIGDKVVDIGPHQHHGYGYNRPVRGMTGYNWNGQDDCFRLNPQQYGGIHFHDDAMIDCKWVPTFTWTIPKDLKSGAYAARLRSGELEDHIPFFVRPLQATAKVCMLLPTASYLAYANERFVLHSPGVEAITTHPLILSDGDYILGQAPEWGLSTYDHHSDGAGVCYSSYKRPIIGMRPKQRMAATGVPWQFPADLSIIYWLEKRGIDYDIQTDEELHREGLACIKPYSVVINGTHSEYYSTQMMNATEQYIDGGGNLIYTGANGYYWAISYRDDDSSCMEVRKLDTGSRAWQAEPGEFYMATTGEKSGLWRARARLPQKLTGVGFASEGMDASQPYRRMPDSYDPEVAWIFEGIEDEIIGDFGLALDGAAGIEIDRYDLTLGTPPNTWLLASSEGHSDNYMHVSEEIAFNFQGLAGTQDFQVRADLTYFKAINGGSVLSTGSIAWGQALPCNNADNNISRIMENVVRKLCE